MPIIVFGLITVNCLVLLAAISNGTLEHICKQFGFTPAEPHLLTLFTAMFVHGGVIHLLGTVVS
jgi:membrane associated rhomboid family serine protease